MDQWSSRCVEEDNDIDVSTAHTCFEHRPSAAFRATRWHLLVTQLPCCGDACDRTSLRVPRCSTCFLERTGTAVRSLLWCVNGLSELKKNISLIESLPFHKPPGTFCSILKASLSKPPMGRIHETQPSNETLQHSYHDWVKY